MKVIFLYLVGKFLKPGYFLLTMIMVFSIAVKCEGHYKKSQPPKKTDVETTMED